MANRRYTQFFNTLHHYPVLLDCNFIVDAANGNGLGIRSLKSPGVQSVYMNTSAPLAGSGNPNPAAGEIVVKLADNYNGYFGGWSGFVGPAGASTTSAKANVINIITVLGTATTAQWVAAGLPIGVTPKVGVAFIGANASVIGGSAQTAIALAVGSNIDHIEVVGNSNLSISNAGIQSGLNGGGSIFYLRCLKNGVLTAPSNGTGIGLTFYMSNTRIEVDGA
jgi:hypothetical protein